MPGSWEAIRILYYRATRRLPILDRLSAMLSDRAERPSRYAQLEEIVAENGCRRMLEVGTWNGDTAARLIRTAREQAPRDAIAYHGFDLFDEFEDAHLETELSKRPPSMAFVEAKLRRFGVQVELYRGDTRETLPAIVPDLPPMDLIFIDGGHSLETVRSDWENIQPVMGPATVVVLDDYYPDRTDVGCKPLVDGLNRDAYDVEVLPAVDVFVKEDGTLTVRMVRVELAST